MAHIEARIIDIQIQPIKGGGPLPLEQALMTPAGLSTVDGSIKDHALFVVDAIKDSKGDYNFLTQRKQIDDKKNMYIEGTRQLALIRPEIRNEGLVFRFNDSQINVPHPDEDDPSRTIPVQVWEYRGRAVEVPMLSEWLSDHLQRDVKVARTTGPWDRKARQNFEINDNPLRAQDGYPVHAISMADVEEVFTAIGQPADPGRARYQILLDGVPAWEMFDYKGGVVNDVEVTQPKLCGRCEVTGVNQQTGELSPVKPLAGLLRTGPGKWVRPDGKKEVVWGVNWLPKGTTILNRGDIFHFTELRQQALVFEARKK